MFGISMPKMFGFGRKKAYSPDPTWATGGASSFINLLRQRGVSYKDSVWIVGGIERTGRALGSLPLQYTTPNNVLLDQDKFRGDQVQWRDLLESPNPLLTRTQIIEMTAMQYSVYGTSYWIKRRKDYSFIQDPLEIPAIIDVALPGEIEPRFGDAAKTRVIGWSYTGSFGVAIPLQFWQVVRFYRTNPESQLYGLSIWQKIGSTISLDASIKASHRDLFDNGGRSHGWFAATKRVDEKDAVEFKRTYDEHFTGKGNYGKAFITPDGIEYKPDGDVRDMDYEKMSKMNRDEEFGATCVPKHHMGVTDNLNFATAEITDQAYWINEIIPLMRSVEDSINSQLMLGSGMRLRFNTDDVPVLANAKINLLDKKLRVGTRAYRLGHSVNEINEVLRMPFEKIEEDWADQPHDPLLEIGKEEPTVTDSGNQGDGKQVKGASVADPFDVAFKGFSLLEGQPAKAKEAELEKDDWDLAYEGDEDAMERVIKQIEDDTILPLVPGMQKTMDAYFGRLGKSQVTRLEAFFSGREFHGKAESEERVLTHADINLVLFDQIKWDGILRDDSLPYHKRAYKASVRRMTDELDGLEIFQQSDAQAAARLQEINAPIVGINTRLRERMRVRLAAQVDVGASSSAMIQSVQQEIGVELKRANMIARTETGMAASRARYDILSVEVPTKRWLSARDSVVRKTHQHYNALGSVVMSYEYARGLKFPLDQGADAGEIINCRCVLVAGSRPTKKPKP